MFCFSGDVFFKSVSYGLGHGLAANMAQNGHTVSPRG